MHLSVNQDNKTTDSDSSNTRDNPANPSPFTITSERNGSGRSAVAVRPLHRGDTVLQTGAPFSTSGPTESIVDRTGSSHPLNNNRTSVPPPTLPRTIRLALSTLTRLCVLHRAEVRRFLRKGPGSFQSGVVTLLGVDEKGEGEGEEEEEGRVTYPPISAASLCVTPGGVLKVPGEVLCRFNVRCRGGGKKARALSFLRNGLRWYLKVGGGSGGGLPRRGRYLLLLLVHLACALRSNAFAVGKEIVVYPEAALFNHSCMPNVGRLQCGGKDGGGVVSARFVALRDIAVGEELCISYCSPGGSTAQRQGKLRAEYGFSCQCALCAGNHVAQITPMCETCMTHTIPQNDVQICPRCFKKSNPKR